MSVCVCLLTVYVFSETRLPPEVSCGNPATPNNARVSGSTYTYGSSLYYSCLSGYSNTGGSTQRTCQSNKSWTWNGSSINCEKQKSESPYLHVPFNMVEL